MIYYNIFCVMLHDEIRRFEGVLTQSLLFND